LNPPRATVGAGPGRRSPAGVGAPARGRGPRPAVERRPPAGPGLRCRDECPLVAR
jgi:hypothetical protein